MPGGYYADVETSPALQQALERLGKLEAIFQERRFDSTVNNEMGLVYHAQVEQAYTNNSSRVSQVHYIKRGGMIQLDLQIYPGSTGHAVDLITGVPLEFRPIKDLRFITESSATPAAGAAGWEHAIQLRTDGGIRNLTYGTTPASITDTSQYIACTAVYLARM